MSEDFDNGAIRQQLAQVLASPDFSAGPNARKLFTHLVTSELDGDGENLTGTALALDVFERGADFDPNSDPVVRVEAVKLRKALDIYYLKAGSEDQIRFSIPKGQYRPVFEPASPKLPVPAAPRTSADGPVLGILEFSGVDTPNALLYRFGLPEEIALELARFSNIHVICGVPGGRKVNLPAVQKEAWESCDFFLSGSVFESGELIRVTVQLHAATSGEMVWSARHEFSMDGPSAFEAQRAIAADCAVRLADAYGVLTDEQAMLSEDHDLSSPGVHRAVLALHSHLRLSRERSLDRLDQLSAKAVRQAPESGLAHAVRALAHVERFMTGQSDLDTIKRDGNPHAEQAISLTPNSQEALFAAAIFARLSGDRGRFERLVSTAVEANPNGSLLTAMAGGWIAISGETRLGADLVRRAVSQNPLLPIWTNVTLCLEQIEEGNFAAASELVHDIDVRTGIGEWMIVCAAHVLAGETELAQYALTKLPMDRDAALHFADEVDLPSSVQKALTKALDNRRN